MDYLQHTLFLRNVRSTKTRINIKILIYRSLLIYRESQNKGVCKILHDLVIVGSIRSTSQCTYYEVQLSTYYEVQLSIVHLIIKSKLVYKLC